MVSIAMVFTTHITDDGTRAAHSMRWDFVAELIICIVICSEQSIILQAHSFQVLPPVTCECNVCSVCV